MHNSWIDTVWSALIETPAILLDPSKRIFWPFLVASFLVAGLVYRFGGHHKGGQSMFSKRVWLHASSLVDLKLLFAQAVIRALLFAPVLLSALAVATLAVTTLTDHFGVANPPELARWQLTLIYTATLFVAWDFSRFALHRLMHAIPFLWELHKVHHSAEVLTPLTNYRTHPLESLLYSLRGAFVTGLVSGVFFYLFHGQAVQYDILGVNAVGMVFNATVANLRHSGVWISYGRRLEHLFISPAQHQLHHSRAVEHHGRNYGSFLAIWDWAFRSLLPAGKARELQVGLSAAELRCNPRSATSCLLVPLASSAKTLVPKQLQSASADYSKALHETN